MTSSLDVIYGEDKNIAFGRSKIIASRWNFAHCLETASSITYIPVVLNFDLFVFFGHFFQKKIVKKNKISKIRDSHF